MFIYGRTSVSKGINGAKNLSDIFISTTLKVEIFNIVYIT